MAKFVANFQNRLTLTIHYYMLYCTNAALWTAIKKVIREWACSATNVFGKGHFSMTWSNIQDLADVSYRVQSTIQLTAFSEEAE
jgi:hypothetical protein